MAVTSSRKSSGPVLRSLSPSGRFHSPPSSASSPSPHWSSTAFASSSSSSFASRSSFFHRSASPTRLNLSSSLPSAASVRFSLDRPISPKRSISVVPRNQVVKKQSTPYPESKKRTCLCAPTTHPGSFRCSLHKNSAAHSQPATCSPSRLNMRRSAMTNSLVRIGTVEGDLVKRALAALIRPSSHHLRRRADFQPRPSRLSIMSRSDDMR